MENIQWDKYAVNYHKSIISPFQKNVKNPILGDIKKITHGKKFEVADVGTGIGDFIPFLSQHFKKVYAIDFSKGMIDAAKKKHSKFSNVEFIKFDIRNLSNLNKKFDVITSINSILLPSIKDIKKCFEEINKSLKNKGTFIGIFPSMEAVLYNLILIYDREYEKCHDEKKALRKTIKIGESKKYNFLTAVYNDNGEKQKLYYDFELSKRLKDAGFKKIIFKKVFYTWNKNISDFENFYGMPEMWDWYIIAEK